MPAKTIVIATGNIGKLREIRAALDKSGLHLPSLAQLNIKGAEEPYQTFMENALAKARYAAAKTKLPALADDSGLVVGALGGKPGVMSARYAGINASDAANNNKLLRHIKKAEKQNGGKINRGAFYYAAMVFVLAAEDPAPVFAEGFWRGEVLDELRGDGGFGYDPLFYDAAAAKTGAQMSPAEKKPPQSSRQIFARYRPPTNRTRYFVMHIITAEPNPPPQPQMSRGEQPLNIITPPPLTLYVHLPWCVRKCPYCDFNSHKAADILPEAEYIAALLADAEYAMPQVWGRRIVAVYLGGGTPNLFSPAALDKLFGGLRALFNLAPDMEITMEANPGAADSGRFAEYRALGISRLSLGAQSFDDTLLTAIGRIHNGKQAQTAAQTAAKVFDNFNIDLMHALPGQNKQSALRDIKIAAGFAPTHLSLYQLTLEPGTPFYRQPPPHLPPDDDAAAISDAIIDDAINRGFLRYEISAFAKNKKECAHNLNYWRFGDYLGIGAGAHSKLTGNGKITRQSRIKNPAEYMRRAKNNNAIFEHKTINGREAVFEFLLNALRLTDGFAVCDLTSRTAMTTSAIEKQLQSAEDDGLINRTITTIKPTALGLRFLNDLLPRFLPQ